MAKATRGGSAARLLQAERLGWRPACNLGSLSSQNSRSRRQSHFMCQSCAKEQLEADCNGWETIEVTDWNERAFGGNGGNGWKPPVTNGKTRHTKRNRLIHRA